MKRAKIPLKKKRISRLTLILLIVLGLIISTRFGWVFWGGSFDPSPEKRTQLQPLAIELKNSVVVLSDKIGDRNVINNYQALQAAADYIINQLSEYGYSPQSQEFTAYEKEVRNIIASREGRSHPDEIIIVGAHYDTCFNPGADDNASGVSGTLALAKKFANQNPAKTVRFVFFVNEEPPFFKTSIMGSGVYCRMLRQQDTNVQGAIILESIGCYSKSWFSQKYPVLIGAFFPNKGNFVAFVSNFKSASLLKKIRGPFTKNSDFPNRALVAPSIVNGVDFSDHRSFWLQEYPAVMVTDTAFFRTNTYHKQTDTYEKLDYFAMAEIINGLEQAIDTMANP